MRAGMARLAASFARLPPMVRGAFWMVVAGFLLSVAAAAVRYLSHSMDPFQISFFRAFFGIFFMLPWIAKVGVRRLIQVDHRKYFLRGVLSVTAMFCWFGGLALIPIAEVTAISFTMPLFASIAAAFVLGETMRLHRWVALAIGFVGMLIIVRPGLTEISLGVMLILAQSICVAGTTMVIKIASRTDPPDLIATLQVVYMTPLALAPAIFFWRWPTAAELALAIVIAGVSTWAQRALSRAYLATEASALQPFDFLRLPIAIALGWMVFSELPDLWTWIGASVIFGSSVFVVRREARGGAARGT